MESNPGIYTPLGLGGYELCHPVDPIDFERIYIEVNGVSRRSTWVPVNMRIVGIDEGRRLVKSDSPWLGDHALIFRDRVVTALRDVLNAYGELLPVECPREDLVIYNPTRLVEALDESRSSLVRFENGRVMMINKYVFRRELVDGVDVFKIPNLRVSPTFLSHRFVDRWNAMRLTGLTFQQVWAPTP